MSVIRSMSIGAAGLRAHSDALSAVGNNIANVNTVGYKRERAVFEDILGRSVAGGNSLPTSGSGSRLAEIERMWTQGALINTGAPTDLAISGDGLFVVHGNVDGVTSNFYTRAGQFSVDSDGFLVNPENLRLQGYPADEAGNISASLGDLRVSGTTIPATPTASARIGVQLDSNAGIDTWNAADPGGSTSATPTTVPFYDSLGNAHEATVYYENTGPGAWTWHAMVDGAELPGGTAGTPTEIGTGDLTFNPDGSLQSDTGGAITVTFDGANPQTVNVDFGTSVTEGGTGFDGSTGMAGTSTNISLSQDGFAGGSVSGVRIEADGTVTGVFSNGQLRTLGAVATADFASTTSLASAGHNLWAQTADSGEPLVGQPGSGGRGTIVSGALEGSNVDLGTEFVDLISFQRGFSANSRIITTADEMYQEIVSMKR